MKKITTRQMAYFFIGLALVLTLMSFSLVHAAAIGGSPQKDTSPVPKNLKRNHDHHLVVNGRSWVSITHEYIGKTPGKTDYRHQHDYTKIDTDFYRWTLVNHTPYTIEFLSMKSWPERATSDVRIETDKVKGKQKKSSVMTLDLTKEWKNNKIPGNKTWTRPNMYYYSIGKNWNKRYFEYTIRINGQIYKLTDTVVYIR